MIIRLAIILFLAAPSFAQFLWNKDHLQQVKQSLKDANSPYTEAFLDLEFKAKAMLEQKDVSVVEKKHTPVSGDKHDYASLSRYYWPDSTQPNGLPYISRDGISNPELKEYDRERLDKMSRRVQTLTLAWFFSGNETYANAAIKQVQIWFINDSTRMNPNMNFAQMIPGRNFGKGFPFGVLDGYSFVEMIDALHLLKDCTSFSKNDQIAINHWFSDYVQWLTTDSLAIEESKAANNHGTTYDTQLLAYSLFIGKRDLAQKIIGTFAQRHILKQIELDGKQPKELKRTQAYHYSWYNLSHMLDFYTIAKNQGFDIDVATEIRGHSFYKGLDYLASYIGKDLSQWPYQQISGWNHVQDELIRDLYRTYRINPNKKNYREIYRGNKDSAGYDIFKLLFVEEDDL